ncbi:MAG: hypothetical protein OEX02_08195 [Cyclobacteriaceae bacterium]|nr:hypothetical protein [Cyclobacteriaceae bacterium]
MEMKVKTLSVVFFTLLMTVYGAAQAQDEAGIADEELVRYAEVMDSIEVLKNSVGDTVKQMVADNEEVSSARYNALYKISKDETKLAEAEVTESELAFLQKVDHYKDSMTTAIKTTFSSLAKDYVGDGGRTYNKINKALKSDTDIKARYVAILEEVKERKKEEVGDDEAEEESN